MRMGYWDGQDKKLKGRPHADLFDYPEHANILLFFLKFEDAWHWKLKT